VPEHDVDEDHGGERLSRRRDNSSSGGSRQRGGADQQQQQQAHHRLLPPLPRSSQPLGMPLPHDEHACSVSLPTWSSVVGYEEGDASVVEALKCGYPRFVYHPYVLQLMDAVLERHGRKKKKQQSGGGDDDDDRGVMEEDCLVLPTAAAAVRCRAFLRQAAEERSGSQKSKQGWQTGRPDDNALLEQPDEAQEFDEVGGSTTTAGSSQIRAVKVCKDSDLAYAVIFPAETLLGMEAKAYWQHTGEVVSSRRAERALQALGVEVSKRVTTTPAACDEGDNDAEHRQQPCAVRTPSYYCDDIDGTDAAASRWTGEDVFASLRQRIGDWATVPSDHVFLAPSGMAAIYAALRSSRRYQMQKQRDGDKERRGGTAIVFGFPYLDTLKLNSRTEICPDGAEFFGFGDENDLSHLEAMLQKQRQRGKNYCALFTEVPSNPLLQCPDLHRLRRLADEYDFCLVIDDTISNFLNVELLRSGLADAVCSSLTKLVSGRGDVIGGSLVTNPHTGRGRWMQRDFDDHNLQTGGMYVADAHALLCNSTDFAERNRRINETSEGLADWLVEHPDVHRVYYPKQSAPLYRSVVQPGGGYGGLLSILLHPHMCQRSFYDALDVAKGPSLGTDFTLVCPYTLLAHYHELDFAMHYNVAPNLLRIAVGLEDLDSLKDKFQSAFDRCRLYPKVCMEKSRQRQLVDNATTQARPFGTTTTAAAPLVRQQQGQYQRRFSTLVR